MFPAPRELLLIVPGLLSAIMFHELAHGYVAFILGDPTARNSGRLTLNPLAHLDLVGTLMLVVARFGWAKPVPVNPRYFKDRDKGMLLVALAGPGANFVLATLATYLLMQFASAWPYLIRQMLFYVLMYNIYLGVFNLIPVPPLDGSRIVRSLAPRGSAAERLYYQMENYGWIVLMLLLISGILPSVLLPLANWMQQFISVIVSTIVI